ncbi:MAG TPA: hypothetical protein VF723_15005 [Pyrinomonadaceae bacterium]|jgi:hypothetical protein
MTRRARRFQNPAEVEDLVRGFESCALPPASFKHREHLAVALCYLSRLTVAETVERMRQGLFRFLDHHGVDRRKYNETTTIFWVRQVRAFLDRADPKRPLSELANELAATYADSKLIFDYYSEPRLSSEAARRAWVEPDLKPLEEI